MKEKKRRKIKWWNVCFLIIFLTCLIFFIISANHVLKWHNDSKQIDDEVKQVQDVTTIIEEEDHTYTEIIEQEEIPKENPYWDYIKMNLIQVDFEKLKAINPDTRGWIQVNGTNINYPFVQTSDNQYYLTHSFQRTLNQAGWVFLDYRNQITGSDKNTILYAHGRLDQTMFGSLKNILSSNWLRDKDHYIVKLSTEYENTLWQVFSIYHLPTTSDYLQIDFQNDSEFLSFSRMLIERSSFDFDTTVSAQDKILTLSTCYNSDEKMVLHAKLIKREPRLSATQE